MTRTRKGGRAAGRSAAATEWMSRAEVACLLQVAPVTVGRWASAGKLPYALTLGGRRRFRREDMLAIARRLSQVSTTPGASR